jgi:DNA-binding transcriptional ArsR family regulator
MLSGAFFTLEINRIEVLFIMKKLQLDYELNKQVKKEKVLWYKISYFEKKYGYCDKTNNDFARMLGVSLATIKRWIKKLEKLGLILKVKSSFWNRKLFAIRPENKVENSVDNSTSEPTNEYTSSIIGIKIIR